MRLQFDASVRSARIIALMSELGLSPTLELWGGDLAIMPADNRAPALGTLIARTKLKPGWLKLPTDGVSDMEGQWELRGVKGLAPTTVTYFRMYRDGLARALIQGDVKLTMFDAAMTINTLRVEAGQIVRVTRFTMIEGNA
jgi:hypothetical protein